jgi:hypothetical protein
MPTPDALDILNNMAIDSFPLYVNRHGADIVAFIALHTSCVIGCDFLACNLSEQT